MVANTSSKTVSFYEADNTDVIITLKPLEKVFVTSKITAISLSESIELTYESNYGYYFRDLPLLNYTVVNKTPYDVDFHYGNNNEILLIGDSKNVSSYKRPSDYCSFYYLKDLTLVQVQNNDDPYNYSNRVGLYTTSITDSINKGNFSNLTVN